MMGTLTAPVPNSYGFGQGKDIALYTVPQMMPLPVNIPDDETNRRLLKPGWRTIPAILKGLCASSE
ncbi:hypothetical protein KCP71_20840 [Salmonella enterica subsp. enterica]|nr:hypothetical protein KCP71_20840 [Salmonella enterica subsp. enterica]